MKLRFILVIFTIISLGAFASYAKETKDIQFKFKNADPVVFSHDFHLNLPLINNNCKKCHNAIFNLRQRDHHTMAEMEKTKSCGACHSGVKAFSVASDKDCVKCHKGKPKSITYKLKGVTDATFSHEAHIGKAGVTCKSCHNGKVITGKSRGITMADMEKGKTCGTCHNGKKAFSVTGRCGSCHKGLNPQDVTFKVNGISNAVFSHKLHLDMDYKCNACHTKTFPYKAVSGGASMTDMEKGKECGLCHNGKDAFTVSGNCDKCHVKFVPGIITFKTDGGDVKFSHEFHLGMYKCPDCHTKVFPYKAGVQHIGMGGMEGGKSCGTCHNDKDAFTTKKDCEKCHK